MVIRGAGVILTHSDRRNSKCFKVKQSMVIRGAGVILTHSWDRRNSDETVEVFPP